MNIRFIHTADWQIGKPFGGFDEALGGALSEARLTAVETVAACAQEQGAGHVLVAGDVYDGTGVSDKTLLEPLQIIRRYDAITWHLLPGNHDFVQTGGIWDRIMRLGLPDNVRLHLASQPTEIAPGAWLLASPLRGKEVVADPTAWMNDATTPDGSIRIGLAHGSVGRFGTEAHASVPIDPDRASKAGLSYLALGDYHGTMKVNDRTWYCGTPEPDGWRDNDPGHALAVTLADGRAVPEIKRLITRKYHWAELPVRVREAGDLAIVEDQIADLWPRPRDILLRLCLMGDLTLESRHATLHRLEALSAQVRYCELDLKNLNLIPGEGDLEVFSGRGDLRTVALRLKAIADDHAHSESAYAQAALAKLFAMVVAKESA